MPVLSIRIQRLCFIAPLFVCAAVMAQPAGGDKRDESIGANATLPESNEAALLTGQFEQAIQRGDHRLAIRLAEKIAELGEELVAVPASRTYYPVWRQAVRLLEMLPPDAVKLYRDLYDAEVQARLQEAVAGSDVDALRKLFRSYRPSSSWPDVGRELVGSLLDDGQFAEAIETLRIMVDRPDGDTADRRAQLVAALGGSGADRAADQVLRRLEQDGELKKRPGWPERLSRLRAWLDQRRDDAPGTTPPPVSTTPMWAQRLVPTLPRSPVVFDDDVRIAGIVESEGRASLQTAVTDGEVIYVRARGTLWAFDALTLIPRWRIAETSPETNDDDSPNDTALLLFHALRHAISLGFDRVFTIERLRLSERAQFRAIASQNSNALVARDAATGELKWAAGADRSHPLFGVAFQAPPLAIDGRLAAIIQRENNLNLCLLDPKTGELIREVVVVGPPTYFSSGGGRCHLVADETTIYVLTGNGVVAALARRDLTWRWAATYSSTIGARLSGAFWGARPTPNDQPINAPVMSDELIIVAPIDCPEVLALDRFSGRLRWRIERGAYIDVIGATDTGIVFAGNSVVCVEASDGKTIRWRSLPLEVTGRGVIADDRVYVPTRDGVVALDGRTGKLVDTSERFGAASSDGDGGAASAEERIRTANLFATRDGLVALSPNRIVKLPSHQALGAEAELIRKRDPADERAWLALAWSDLLAGRRLEALQKLESATPHGPGFVEARDELLTNVFVALANESATSEQRLAWLRRAAEQTTSPEMSGRLAKLIGEALERAGAVDEARAHYEKLLIGPMTQISESAAGGRTVASWLFAVERLRELGTKRGIEGDALQSAAREGISRGELPWLLRVRPFMRSAALGAEVDRVLLLGKLPPELLMPIALRCGDDESLGVEERRALALARWTVFTSVGSLSHAEREQVLWSRLHGDAAATRPASEEAESREAEQAGRLQTAMSKLRRNAVTKLDEPIFRSWRTDRVELLEDRRNKAAFGRPFVFVRDQQHRRIQLLDAHGAVQRPTENADDGMIGKKDGPRARLDVRALDEGSPQWPMPNSTWPTATYGYLAAVPTVGGVVAFGAGCERGGGQRLWECAVADWVEFPIDAAERFVAGPLGVYFSPRPDRVQMIGWGGGEPWWQLDLDDFAVQRLEIVGDRLIIYSTEQRMFSVDATFGSDLHPLNPNRGLVRDFRISEEGLLTVWSERTLMGLDPRTLEPRWMVPLREFGAWTEIVNTRWLLIRPAGSTWQLLDAKTGTLVQTDLPIGAGELVIGAARDGDMIYTLTASPIQAGPPIARLQIATLTALRADTREARWTQAFPAAMGLHLSQLTGHPDFIPLLVAPDATAGTDQSLVLPNLQLKLVKKSDGGVKLTAPIGAMFEGLRIEGAGVYMIATEPRLYVQVGGAIVAIGSKSPGSER